MKEEMTKLENYNLINNKKAESKEVFNNGEKLFEIRSKIIKAFKNGIFSMHKENLHKKQTKEEKEEKKEETISDWVKVGNYVFKRIRERVNNYVSNGWYSRVNKKSITMNPVKKIL